MVIMISIVVVAVAMIAMAAGIILKGRAPRLGCGKNVVFGPDGKPVRCDNCTCQEDKETNLNGDSHRL